MTCRERSVNRDPVYFPEPEAFDPQRWIGEDGTLRDDVRTFPFGFGRRYARLYLFLQLSLTCYHRNSVCPGQHLATASTYLNTSLTLWAFNVREDEKDKIDVLAFTESANAHPMPFKVVFEPRLPGGWEGVKEAFELYGM